MSNSRLERFGVLEDGDIVTAAVIGNERGVTARVLTYGAALQSLEVPDRDGAVTDVVLGHATLAPYLDRPQYFGAIVGRFANRIRQGSFAIDGRHHQVPASDGEHALHGGKAGFDKLNWTIGDVSDRRVALHLHSPSNDQGFPGAVDVQAIYELDDTNAMTLTLLAETDQPTVINLANHTYFNLRGEGCGDALGHLVTIHADEVTAVDASLIPTGEIIPVAGTPLDFRTPRRVSAFIRDAGDAQIRHGRGYDINYVLRGDRATVGHHAVRVEEPESGRVMSIETTEPGLQFYSGNFLDGTTVGKSGRSYRQGDGLAFETQHFPDSPNHPHFPSTRLDPGVIWRSTTVWRFSTSERK